MPGPLILVFDDSDLVLEVTRFALEAAGYRVETVKTVAALTARRDGADLIVMDVQTPEAEGDDVAAELKAIRGLRAPIVLYSSLPEAELAERAGRAGVDGYLSKRAGVEALVTKIDDLLGHSTRGW